MFVYILHSSINYNIRLDLVPNELEAVCTEIMEPHSCLQASKCVISFFFNHLEKLIIKTKKCIFLVILTVTC